MVQLPPSAPYNARMLTYLNNEGVAFEWHPCEECGKLVATVETHCSACGTKNPRWVPLDVGSDEAELHLPVSPDQ